MSYAHSHGYIRVKHQILWLVLSRLHLPTGWLVESGVAPHHPDCTPDTGVIEQ